MKCIWLGVKDYCKDCWHDWLWLRLEKLYKDPDWIITYYNPSKEKFCEIVSWKEGNLWHYIQQEQKISKGCKINLWKIIPHRHIYRLGDYGGKRCRRCGRFRKLEQKDRR